MDAEAYPVIRRPVPRPSTYEDRRDNDRDVTLRLMNFLFCLLSAASFIIWLYAYGPFTHVAQEKSKLGLRRACVGLFMCTGAMIVWYVKTTAGQDARRMAKEFMLDPNTIYLAKCIVALITLACSIALTVLYVVD